MEADHDLMFVLAAIGILIVVVILEYTDRRK
jgi:hypothetical protein